LVLRPRRLVDEARDENDGALASRSFKVALKDILRGEEVHYIGETSMEEYKCAKMVGPLVEQEV
jgi:hypothetical protein